MTMKLKQLLEGYAWERNADGSLPTLADATAKYESNLKEQDDIDHLTSKEDSGKEKFNTVLDIVSRAEDLVQNLRNNTAANTGLERSVRAGYLKAYNELLDILSDIGYEIEIDMYSVAGKIKKN